MRAAILACAASAIALASCNDIGGLRGKTNSPVAETEEPTLETPRFRISASAFSHEETLRRLYQAIDRRDLTVFAVIDHAAGAAQVDLEMPPSTVVIFGSARLGTALMLAEPQLAAELPLRAAVYEDFDGSVMLAVTSIPALSRSYDALVMERARTGRIEDNLAALAEEVTGTE